MRADLLARAQTSIAFNTAAADTINSKLAEIDKRLFGFAYYTPVPLRDTSAHACFYLAVLNMYSLIWDCGPMLNSLLWEMKPSRNGNTVTFPALSHDCTKLRKVLEVVGHIRSDICHNNYQGYRFNKDSHREHKEFLDRHSAKISDGAVVSEDVWGNICMSFLDMCHEFCENYIQITEQVKRFSADQKAAFVEKWLLYTGDWYKRNLDISLNILAELYPLSLGQKGRSPQRISKSVIYSFFADNAPRKKESCLKKIQDTLDEELEKRLKSKASCPAPALPRPVLLSIFKPKVL